MQKLMAVINVSMQILNKTRRSFWLTETSVIKANCLYLMVGELMGDMCSMSDVWVESMEHDNDCFGISLGGVLVGGEKDHFLVLIDDFELKKVLDGEEVVSLWVGRRVLILLGMFYSQHFLFFSEFYVLPILVKFTWSLLHDIFNLIMLIR